MQFKFQSLGGGQRAPGRGVCRKSDEICCRHLSPSIGRVAHHTFPRFISGLFQKVVCYVLVTLLYKERGGTLIKVWQKPNFFKASFEAPEEISRKGE